MDGYCHGLKSFKNRHSVDKKSKTNRSLFRCDDAVSWIERLSSSLLKYFRKKQSIFSVHVLSVLILACIPSIVSAEQPRDTVDGVSNNPVNAGANVEKLADIQVGTSLFVSSSNALFDVQAKQIELRELLAALSKYSGIPITIIDEEQNSSVLITISLKQKTFKQVLQAIRTYLPAGGIAVVNDESASTEKHSYRRVYVFTKEGSESLKERAGSEYTLISEVKPSKEGSNDLVKKSERSIYRARGEDEPRILKKEIKNGVQVSYVADQLLIRIDPGANINATIRLLDRFVKKHNGVLEKRMSRLKYFVARFSSDADIEQLSRQLLELPYVYVAEPNYIAEATDISSQPVSESEFWHLERINVTPDAQSGSIVNVSVAVVDTGVNYNIPELVGKVEKEADIVNHDDDPMDDNGHGTNMALLISQVSPRSIIYAIKALDESGIGTYADVAEGIFHALDNHVSVINLSLGGYAPSQMLQDAIRYAHMKGVTVVAATGNDGNKNMPFYPAAYANVIGVGAIDASNIRTQESNTGDFVDLVAPGSGVKVINNGMYLSLNGTSVASALVAGSAALQHIDNGYTVDEISARLYGSAADLGETGKDFQFGYGLLNVERSLSEDLQLKIIDEEYKVLDLRYVVEDLPEIQADFNEGEVTEWLRLDDGIIGGLGGDFKVDYRHYISDCNVPPQGVVVSLVDVRDQRSVNLAEFGCTSILRSKRVKLHVMAGGVENLQVGEHEKLTIVGGANIDNLMQELSSKANDIQNEGAGIFYFEDSDRYGIQTVAHGALENAQTYSDYNWLSNHEGFVNSQLGHVASHELYSEEDYHASRDALYLNSIGATCPNGISRDFNNLCNIDNRTPILLLHGWIGDQESWSDTLLQQTETEAWWSLAENDPLSVSVEKNEQGNTHESYFEHWALDSKFKVFKFRYTTNRSNIYNAQRLVELIRNHPQLSGRNDLILVGHSTGGLVAKYALIGDGLGNVGDIGDNKKTIDTFVNKVITLATPHRGSFASFDYDLNFAEDMYVRDPVFSSFDRLDIYALGAPPAINLSGFRLDTSGAIDLAWDGGWGSSLFAALPAVVLEGGGDGLVDEFKTNYKLRNVNNLLLDPVNSEIFNKFIFYAGWVESLGLHNNNDSMILADLALSKVDYGSVSSLDSDSVVTLASGLLLDLGEYANRPDSSINQELKISGNRRVFYDRDHSQMREGTYILDGWFVADDPLLWILEKDLESAVQIEITQASQVGGHLLSNAQVTLPGGQVLNESDPNLVIEWSYSEYRSGQFKVLSLDSLSLDADINSLGLSGDTVYLKASASYNQTVNVSDSNGGSIQTIAHSDVHVISVNITDTQIAPTITDVDPPVLLGLPVPETQPLTIKGTGFSSQTRLTFDDGIAPPYQDRVPVYDSEKEELRYDIVVGTDAANWTVVAYNGTATSSAFPFSVTAGAAAPVVSLSASSTQISSGQSISFSWSSSNATSCEAFGGSGDWNGSQTLNGSGVTVTPLITTDYVLICTGPGGSRSDEVTVEVTDTSDYVLTMTTDQSPVVSGANNPLVYTLVVRNQGTSALTGVVLRDDVPAGMDVQSYEAGGGSGVCGSTCTSSEYLTWSLGDLAVGESKVVQFIARQTGTYGQPAGFLIHNTMSVTDDSGGSASRVKDVAVEAGNGFVVSLVESQDPVVPGDELTYTVNYTNRSGSTVANAALIVPIPEGTSYMSATPGAVHDSSAVLWVLGSMASGESGEQQLTVSVTGSAEDVIKADALLADTSGAVPSQLSQILTEVQAAAPLLLTMTTDQYPVVSGANNPLVYTLVVRNQGTSALTGVVLRDDVPAGMDVQSYEAGGGSGVCGSTCTSSEYLTWSLGDLAVGESKVVQFMARQTGTYGQSAGFLIHNEISVTAAGGGYASLAKDVPVVAGSGFTLSLVESRDPVVPGEQLTYTVNYTNRSGSTVANAVLSVPIPAGTSYVSASAGGVYTGSAVQWSLGSLANGASGEQQLTVNVTGSAEDVILADALLADVSGAVPTLRTQITTEVQAVAPLLLTMTTDQYPVVSGANNPLVYTLVVRNQGTSALTGVVLRDDVPAGMDVQSYEAGGGSGVCGSTCTSSEYLTWSLGDLAVGESKVVQFMARQTGTYGQSAGFLIHNEISVTAAGGGYASLAKDVPVVAGSGFTLSLVESRDPVVPGEQLTYTVNYTNRSGSTVANAVLSVPIPADTSYVSASAGGVYTGSAVQWSLGSLANSANGEQQLTVSVTGSAEDVILADALLADVSGAVPTLRTQITTEVQAVAPLLLTMTTDQYPVVSGANNPLVYTLVVRNQGTSALTGVVLRDDVPVGMDVESYEGGGGSCSVNWPCGSNEHLTWSLGDLAVGESKVVQFMARQTGTYGQSAGFLIHNEISVTAAGGGNASLAKDVPVVGGNGFTLSLVESRDPVVPGDQLTYTVNYTNRSGSMVANAVLSVPIPAGTSYVSASAGGVYTGSAVQWSLGSLANATSGEQQLTVNVTGSVEDVILADALLEDVSGAVPTLRTQITTEVQATAPLLLTMTTDQYPVVSGANNPLVYTLVVRNQGASALTGVVLRDDVPVGMDVESYEGGGGSCSVNWPCGSNEHLTWSLGDLAVGESKVVQFMARQTGTYGQSAGFLIHNEISVTAAGGGNASLAKDVPVVGGNGFTLSLVESRDPVVPGEQLTYTVNYTNRSGSTVANAVLSVPIPADTSYVSASAGGVYTGSAVQWSLGSLANSANGEQQLTVSVTGSAEDVILADALLADVSGAVPTLRTQITTEVQAVAPLLLTMTTDQYPVVSGANNPLVYTLVVRNQGTSALTGVVLRDDVPVGMDVESYEGGGGSCSVNWPCGSNEHLTWSLGDLAVGESKVVQFMARQTGTYGQSAGFLIHNEISVTAAGGGNASLAKDVPVVGGNGFTLSLVESRDPVVPGDQLTYTVNYTNRSGSMVANAVLSVPIPAGTSYVSASAGGVYTGSAVQWSLGSLANATSGEQQLTVNVTGSVEDVILADALLEDVSGAVPTLRTQITTEVQATAPLLLTMTTDQYPVVSGANNPLVYTLVVRNQGTSALTGVVLRDDVPVGMDVESYEGGGGSCSVNWPCGSNEHLTWSLGDLAVGESKVVQFMARQTGTYGQSAGFLIHNEISVTAAGGGNASLAKDVPVVGGNGFTLSLVESRDPVVPGDQLTYTVHYANRSGSMVANAVLSVPIPAGTSYVSASAGGVYTGSAVQWSLGSLANATSGEQQLTVNVTGSVEDVILADALLEDVSGAVPTLRTQITTEVQATAPLLLTMTTDQYPVVSGANNPLVYTLVVRNQGASALTGVVLRDDVPVGMDVQSYEAGGGNGVCGTTCTSTEYLTWSLGDLAVGESKVVQFMARQTSNLSTGFLIHNEISVTAAEGASASLAKDVPVVSGNDDSDGDGLTNSVEDSIGTNMLLWDTDGDGLSDYEEVSYDGDPGSYVDGQDLNPFIIDTDGDGFSDYEEVNTYNSDPLDINSVPVLADGDLNADGVVNVVDVLMAQQIVSGQLVPTQDQLDHGDVAPLVNGTPVPDGLFNVGDLLLIQRKALGLVNF